MCSHSHYYQHNQTLSGFSAKYCTNTHIDLPHLSGNPEGNPLTADGIHRLLQLLSTNTQNYQPANDRQQTQNTKTSNQKFN